VQVGAFANPKNAQRLGDRLVAERYRVAIRPGESQPGLVSVLVGAYQNRRQAETARAALEKKGITGFVVRRKPQ
jgi:cell division septation protein DedD